MEQGHAGRQLQHGDKPRGGQGNKKKNWPAQCSIVDITLKSSVEFPLDLPTPEYVEEAFMGIRGSPNDQRLREWGGKLIQSVDLMHSVIRQKGEAVQNVCASLFWIAVGLLFERFVMPQVLAAVRGQLAHNWHLVHLKTTQEMPEAEDREMRDWVLSAFPIMLVQAIYRLLCDAFPGDRAQLVGKAQSVLDKLSHIVHFEISGFQIQLDTSRKERRRLFNKHVLQSPHVALSELESFRKRQEAIESQNHSVHDMPLAFGQKDLPGLEETQLECLLKVRETNQRENRWAQVQVNPAVASRQSIAASKAKNRRNSAVEMTASEQRNAKKSLSSTPITLGVDRYNGLSERGHEMLSRHLHDIARCLGEPEQDEESSTSEAGTSELASQCTENAPKSTFVRVDSWVADGRGEESVAGDEPGSPKSASSKPAASPREGSRRREVREKQKAKARTELLIEKLNGPLCQELCDRKITTTWVSPALSRLCTGATDKKALDRNLLRKPPTEARHVSMADAPSIVSRPASAPMRKPGTPAIHQSSAPRLHHSGHGHGAAPTGHVVSTPAQGQRRREGGGEILTLEIQQLNRRTMMQRLDTQTKFFRQQAFGNYMKEYDIFTGAKKARLNGSKLKEEEKAYVAEMQKMVGGQALRLNPFSKNQAARMAAVCVGR